MLTDYEKQRKADLLHKYADHIQLSQVEIAELKDLIKRDEEMSDGERLLLILALGVLLAYVFKK